MASKRRAVIFIFRYVAILLAILGIASCGGSTSLKSTDTAMAAEVRVTPTSASMVTGESQQFLATVSGTADEVVKWALTGPGTLSSTGLYTAPDSLSTASTATIVATSADPSRAQAHCIVKLNPVALSISPTSATLTVGATEQFSAKITGSNKSGVTWSVSGPGSISNAGLYTAPAKVASNTPVVIKATSSAFPWLSQRVTITIAPSQPVSVSPANVSLYAGGTQQFSASFSGTPTTAVTWSLAGAGTLSNSGLYTAPASVSTDTTATVTATSTADPSMQASATISVAPETIEVTPSTASLHPGDTTQFSAKVTGVSGTSVQWVLSGPGTLSGTGLYTAPKTATSTSTATITAVSTKATTLKGHAHVSIEPQTISLSPVSTDLFAGGSAQFTATLTGVVDQKITWSVAGPGTISKSGVYTAPASVNSLTTAVVTATSQSVSTLQASATVTLNPQSISVTPGSASLQPGATAQFSATLVGVSNSAVTWKVSGPGTISSSGLYTAPATATAATSATITATSTAVNSLSASATVNISSQTISITPSSAKVDAGGNAQFSATLSGLTDNSVTWSVSGPGAISNSGLYTAPANAAAGSTATVTATSVAVSSLKASATVTIGAQSIAVTPSSAKVDAGGNAQFSASLTGVNDNSVTWSVSGLGTISNSGLYTAPANAAAGSTATVTATSVAVNSLKATATVTIGAQSIAVTPSSAKVDAGGNAQFSASLTGVNDNSVTWSVSGPGTISNSGLYTAPDNAAAGSTATITATSVAVSSLKASATVTIGAQSVSITPTNATLDAGDTTQFSPAVTGLSDKSVTWSLSGPGTISNSGLYTAPDTSAAGATATVTVTSNAVNSVKASATIHINAQTITVSPTSSTLSAGATAQFSATVSGVSSTAVTWSLSGPGTLSNSGLYTAPASVNANGASATITATSSVVSGLSASATVTLKGATIAVTPSTSTIYATGTAQFSAAVTGASDTSVTWSLSGPGTISTSGQYTAPASVNATTTATVTATSNAIPSLSDTATVTIKPQTISVSPQSASITAGGTKQFSSQVVGASDTSVTWSLSGSGTLSSSGLYSAPASVNSTITATITATSNAENSLTASATITVSPASSNPSGTAITSCGQSLQANNTYYLANDVGSSASSLCFSLTGPNLVLNLNGHKITGTLKAGAINPSGVHLYNGSITCSDADPNQPGCLYMGVDTDSPAITKPLEIDHISWINSSNTSNNSERNMMIDFGGMTKTAISGPNVLIHDNTSVSALGISSSRIVNLQVQGTAHSNIAYVEFYNNATLCQAKAAACQGIVAYGLWNTKVHNNTFVNQMADPSSTETPRAVICDQTDGCEIYSNTFDAQDGRAVRMRGSNAKNDVNAVHDNTINNVKAGSNNNEVAAIHIGDPDSGTEVENANIYNNTINATTGWVFMARSATGITISDNTLNTSMTVNLLDARNDGSATGVTLQRTTIVGGTASSFCESGVSVKVCKSGNVSGSCSMNNSGC